MRPAFRSAAGIGTELCQLDSADLDVLPHVFQKYPETMRRRAYVYGHKREGCPVLQRGQKCDQRFQNTQNLPLSALQTENPCPEIGKASYEQCAGFIRIPDGKNPLEITGVHPESYKIAGNMLVHHRKKYYT